MRAVAVWLVLCVLTAALPAAADEAGVPDLIARLHQTRPSTDAQRRAVLARFKADVPGPKGQFATPPRTDKPPPDPDWLAELSKMKAGEQAVVDTTEIVATLRALADSHKEEAADAILAYAFDPVGITFRDECGRQLRRMSPHSLATLMRASQDKKRAEGAYARYAAYQLDRLEKSRPAYALAAAPTDEVEVAMLHAVRDVKHPDAVTAVLDRTDAPSHAVRAAAREAWMAYVTGPAPPPAPKAKRKLPGGKLTPKPLPLYLTYREFAENELRRVLLQLTGTEPPESIDGEAMTKQLFELYDQRRTARWDQPMTDAAELAKQGKWSEVGARYDAILQTDPTYSRRAEMAPSYLALGRELAKQGKWEAAALALHKAYSLDPTGPQAKDAEAELYYARSQKARAAGKTGDADLAKALAVKPDLGSARAAAAQGERARRSWMLFAGAGAALLALVLVFVALARRRA